jgi:hypothetical protein
VRSLLVVVDVLLSPRLTLLPTYRISVNVVQEHFLQTEDFFLRHFASLQMEKQRSTRPVLLGNGIYFAFVQIPRVLFFKASLFGVS